MIMLKQLYHTRMRRKGKMHLNGLMYASSVVLGGQIVFLDDKMP